MATVTAEPSSSVDEFPLFRISLDLYHQMVESGLLGTYDRVVLLDGLLVEKMPKGPRHSTVTRKGLKALEAIVPEGWHVRKEDPISLTGGPEGADSEPEPDLAIVRGDDDAYRARHPGPGEIALIVEVADSSVARDRAGLRRYAWAGIPRVWIVNLVAGIIEVHTEPSGPIASPSYAQRADLGLDAALLVMIDGQDRGPILAGDFLE